MEGNLDILQKIWEWAKEYLSRNEMNNKLLFTKDCWGRAFFYMVARSFKLNVLQKI